MIRVFVFGMSVVAIPSLAFAQTLFQVAGVLNIFVGLMVTAAFVTFGVGLLYYFANFVLERRKVGIYIMEWGVSIVFVLIVLLTLVRFIRHYTETVLGIVSFAVFVFIIIVLIHFATTEHKERKKKE